jgi:hypothetical protein
LIRGGVERHTCQVSNLENLQDKTFKCVVRWELIPVLLKLLGVPELDGMWYAHCPKVEGEIFAMPQMFKRESFASVVTSCSDGCECFTCSGGFDNGNKCLS